MGYMRLHLPNQLAFFLAMVVSSAFPVIAQRDSVDTGEQAKKISPKFIDTTFALSLILRAVCQATKFMANQLLIISAYTASCGVCVRCASPKLGAPVK